MEKQHFDQMDPKVKRFAAIAHMMQHPELQPDGSQVLFSKLVSYDGQAKSVDSEIKDAKKFIGEAEVKLHQLFGSMEAVSDIISETIDPAKIEEYCLAYEPPEGVGPKRSQRQPAAATSNVDMAGATSKDMPPVDIKGLSKGA